MVLKTSAISFFWSCHAPQGVRLSSAPWPARSIESNGLARDGSRRLYATVSASHQSGQPDSAQPPNPPPAWPTCADPSPYDILGCRRGDTYSKARFYQLVKLYHPDRRHPRAHHSSRHHSPAPAPAPRANAPLSAAVRLERYRLVVLANDILSDPHKRRAYDLWGTGWGADAARSGRDVYRRADRSWRNAPGSAANNATWEDWERWREAQSGKNGTQQPVFMSNMGFAFLVLMFVAVGGIAQASRAGSHSSHVIETKQEAHAAISEDMMRRSMAMAGQSSTDRVETFLRERENSAYSFSPGKYDTVSTAEKPK